jgi:hypothetical protein
MPVCLHLETAAQVPIKASHIIQVLHCRTCLKGDPIDAFKAGARYYLLADANLMWEIEQGTCLVVTSCDLPLNA